MKNTNRMNIKTWMVFTTRIPPTRSINPEKRWTSHIISPVKKVIGALKRNGWNVTRAAKETGMQRSNLQALMKKYDIRIRGIEPDFNDD